MPDSQVGVLIDFENVGSSNLHNLFDQISEVGRIIVKRAYADWTKIPRKSEEMLELGIEAKHYFRASGSGKNASDICLAIDAIDLLYRTPIDTFVIVSSDTDFVPLVSTLRSVGKVVVGAGHRGVVSPALVHSCDRYIYLDDGTSTLEDTSDLKRHASQLLLRAVDTSVDEQGRVVASKLHNTMLRIDPSFDYRAMGYKSFTQFLGSSDAIKVQRRGGHGDVVITLAAQSSPPARTVRPAPPASAASAVSAQPAPAASAPAQPAPAASAPPAAPLTPPPSWEFDVDVAWAKIPGNPISSSKAATEAAKVLGEGKLSSSSYRNLQGLLDASELLRSRWSRRGNSIVPLDLFHDGEDATVNPGTPDL